jgi:hypothetical protein
LGFLFVSFGCVLVYGAHALDEFVYVAVSVDWDHFVAFYEYVCCHSAVWVCGEFDIVFVFECGYGSADWDDYWYGVEV